jgi:BirA family biotin operon repressor/biotin-[acetyl-CoA-carboxylase] ligase
MMAKIQWYDTLPSTNDTLKELARNGAPAGTAIAARTQTGGKGRRGRTFQSPAGTGMYLSVLLRPNAKFEDCMHLTCAVAAAVNVAIEGLCGVVPGIKWPNDLTWENRKLGGILTEVSAVEGVVEWAVVGIGINCRPPREAFSPDVALIATDLQTICGKSISPETLAEAVVTALEALSKTFLSEKDLWMDRYRENCVTTGRQVCVISPLESRQARAIRVEDDGSLLVEYPDGGREAVSSGEVSVRGMYGYS